jgi:hypothetical protein
MPGSLLWTIQLFTQESLNISVIKTGRGLRVTFAPKDLIGLETAKFPAAYSLKLAGNWHIAFGAESQAPDALLMQYLVNITAPWLGKEYGIPWQIFLNAQPWRTSETGEIGLAAAPTHPQDVDPHSLNPQIPMNAAQPRTFSAATRPKEIAPFVEVWKGFRLAPLHLCGLDIGWFKLCHSHLSFPLD